MANLETSMSMGDTIKIFSTIFMLFYIIGKDTVHT